MAFRPVFAFALAIFLVEVALLLFLASARMSLLALVNAGLCCVLAAALTALLSSFLYAVRVSAVGIRGHDAWRGPCYLRWNQSALLRPGCIFPFRYLVLSHDRGRKLWLPLFLRDMDGFRVAVHQHAPSGHPLRPRSGFSLLEST